jgi:type IV secretory pathway TraG/TraD family ATPase VirD4
MSLRQDASTWEPSTLLLVAGLAAFGVVSAVIDLGVHAWAWTAGVEGLSWNPFDIVIGLARGSIDTTTGVWRWVGGSALAFAAPAVATVALAARGKRRYARGDEAGRLAGTGRDIAAMGEREVRAKAQRLGAGGSAFGLPIGLTVASRARLWSDFEAVCLLIAGPRTGKTSAWAVPRIFAAPAVVVATSNKRDILDITRERRAQRGRVWAFDPQGIANEPQAFWWDALSYVTDSDRAGKLADVFLTASTGRAGGEKNEWENWSCNLIAAMLLAAAKAGMPLIALHRWINDQTEDEPVQILKRAGEETTAISLQGIMDLVPETRSGVYGGAGRIMNFLTSGRIMRWVTPLPGLPEFRPEDFVRSPADTLYLLSQEGSGSAGPIVTALTVAVTDAAEAYANQSGGRMPTPMYVPLDEAANVCRWRELPDKYSHFGSKGILVDTLLQSWSQGVSVWGEAGMKKLWSASNVKAYGGGVSEREFLSLVSDLIGAHWVDSTQISSSPTGRSVSTSRASQQRPIATVADLQALPAGRAWIFASLSKGTLAELVPYWHGGAEAAA